MKRPSCHTTIVALPQRRLSVEYRYFPGRLPSRAGPDSPRYMDQGRQARVQILHLFDDRRIEQAKSGISPQNLTAIESAIKRGINGGRMPAYVEVKPDSTAPAFCDYTEGRHAESADQFPLPVEDGHLARAMRRTE